MIVLALTLLPAMLIRRGADPLLLLLVDLPLFVLATLSVLGFYVAGQSLDGERERHRFLILPAVMALGIGLSVNNARAVVAGLLHWGGVFVRTPKYSIEARGQRWRRKRYRAAIDWGFALEGALLVSAVVNVLFAVHIGMWAAIPFLLLFVNGFAWVFALSLRDRLRPLDRPEPALAAESG
jgi:hypothetical protein